jgi:hypothetical protein
LRKGRAAAELGRQKFQARIFPITPIGETTRSKSMTPAFERKINGEALTTAASATHQLPLEAVKFNLENVDLLGRQRSEKVDTIQGGDQRGFFHRDFAASVPMHRSRKAHAANKFRRRALERGECLVGKVDGYGCHFKPLKIPKYW